MKRDIKKRLEKALVVLQEPGGSTIRSIIKVINKEAPILSLRKVLEALQEGMNEGFVCMYNGRFKLKQQLNSMNNIRDKFLREARRTYEEEKDSELEFKASNSDVYEDGKSEFSSSGEKLTNVEEDSSFGRTQSRYFNKLKNKKGNHFHGAQRVFCIAPKNQSSRHGSKLAKVCNKSKRKLQIPNKKSSKRNKQLINVECDSVLDVAGDCRESNNTSNRQAPEKLDVKKQRGPRCTSMKKDVRMPSKVHIPFMLPSVPQRSNTFNELLRRSPEPVNGPLFDSYNEFSCKPDKLEFFKPYY